MVSVRTALKQSTPLDIFEGNISDSTRRLYKAALLRWAEFTEDTELAEQIKLIPIERRGSKPVKITTAFTDEEIDRFHEVLDRAKGEDPVWLWPALRMFTFLGLRAGIDLCGLQRSALKEALRTGILQLWTKRERRRVVPTGTVTEEVKMLLSLRKWTVLADLIAPTSSPELKEITAYKSIRKWLRLIGRQAGIDPQEMQSRRFRNTAAQRLYRQTKDPHLVQKFLGHASIDTTVRYLNPNRIEEIDEAMKEMYKTKSEGEENEQ
jgi:integrase